MSYAEDKKALNKYKLQKRKELNKKYPKGGKEFIKAVNDLRNLSVAKFKNLGVKPVPTQVVEKKIKKENTNKNIVKVKNEIKRVVTAPKEELPQPKAMPQSIKDMRAKNKDKKENKKTGSKTAASASNTKDFEKTKRIQKELNDKGANIKVDGIMGAKTRAAMKKFSSSSKKVSDMTTREVMERNQLSSKTGDKKVTAKQRLTEIDREKNSPKTNKALDAVFAMLSKGKTKKLKSGGTPMKKKTKYMAKGGAGMKKTKYMAKGGMKKPMTMKKTMGYARGGAAKKK